MLLLGDILRAQAVPQRRARKVALIVGEVRLTYGELNEHANRLANSLLELGLQHGDRVAVLGRNCLEHVVIYFALAKVGAIMVPVNFWYRASEIKYTLDQSDSRFFLLDERFHDTVRPIESELPSVDVTINWGARREGQRFHVDDLIARGSASEPHVEVHEDDPHIILYTSGTTGFPKGAIHTHRTHYLHALAWAHQTRQHEDDVGLCVYPLFHTGGPDCVVLPHFLVGGTVVVLDGADPRDMLAAVRKHRLTNVFCVPTVWRRLLACPDIEGIDLGSVERCLGSSDTLPEDLLDEILGRFNADVYVTYGLTEAGCILTFSRLTRSDRDKIASVGQPHPLAELRIVDPDGVDVGPGEVGEIIARGSAIMPGYWRMPEQTAETLRDGWLWTGDLGRFDDDGYVYIAGRSKDVIISGGEKIYPVEVEKIIQTFAGVRQVAVIGVPDREWGESVLAAIVPEPGAVIDGAAVTEFVRSRLAGYKKPRYVEIVDALPATSTGKVRKGILRDQLRSKYRSTHRAD